MNESIVAFFKYPHRVANVHHWPLLGSPWPIHYLLGGYLLIVLKLGPIFMKNRKPYDVKKAMIVYNIFQVIYNAVMVCIGIYYLFIRDQYDLKCITHLEVTHPDKYKESRVSYIFFINKICDLTDTVFFVLRKSYKQITFLHVFHHFVMVCGNYWIVNFYGFGGQYITMGFLNSIVHTVMYAYYCISIVYPQLRGNRKWKKYVTQLQFLQFLILLCQALFVVFFNPSCTFPMPLQYMQIAMSSLMIILFGNFYYNAYLKAKNVKSKDLSEEKKSVNEPMKRRKQLRQQ